MVKRWGPQLLLAVLGLVFFSELVLHPTQTLYSDYSDLFILHLPAKKFLVRSWQETGELPLWCPYNFAGLPFLHDIQVSAFYPAHWPLLLLPEERLGAALSWLVVVHVIVAGWTMYAYARHEGLHGAGAFVAAIGYMFTGKWLLHILAGGHYNMVPLAWLPLVLLWLEQAIQRRSLLRATWAGAAFSLFILGAYPYVTLYAGVFLILWTFGIVVEQGRSRILQNIVWWTGLGTWSALIAVALGAVQLLPGMEAAAGASRSAGVAVTGETLLNGIRSVVGLVGPPLTNEPNCWENRAGLGVLWLGLAVLAPRFGSARTRYQAGVCLLLFGFVLGGSALVQWVPGFRLFRLPSRMFLIIALPVALLAGKTTQAIFQKGHISPEAIQECRGILVKLTLGVLFLAGVYGLTLTAQRRDWQLQYHPYWITLILTIPGICWLLSQRARECNFADNRRHGSSRLCHVWALFLGIDMAALTRGRVAVRPEEEIFSPSPCVRYLAQRRHEHGRILDFNPEENAANHTPLWPGLPVVERIEPLRGFNPIDVRRYKEYLQFITNEDKPLETIDGMFTGPILGTFPIVNQGLADLLGVRYLVQPANLPLGLSVQDPAGRKFWKPVLEDSAAKTFNIISVQAGGTDCGLQPLPPYRIYENQNVFPRAFVVPEAVPLPDHSRVLAELTATDFRRRVLLEDFENSEAGSDLGGISGSEHNQMQVANVREYRPNRITLDLDAKESGYLVLTDVWFPGWTCMVDGQPACIHRANYLFRAVAVPAGAKQVVFTFAPQSYAWGKAISFAGLVLVIGLSVQLPLLQLLRASSQVSEERKRDAVLC